MSNPILGKKKIKMPSDEIFTHHAYMLINGNNNILYALGYTTTFNTKISKWHGIQNQVGIN